MLYHIKRNTLAAGLLFLSTTTCFAAPPTLKAGFASLTSISSKMSDAGGNASTKVKAFATHTFEISESVENALLNDVVISISGGSTFSFALADDPNFENGDKSAKLRVVTPITGMGISGSDVRAYSAKWGNGILTIRCSSSVNVKQQVAPSPVLPGSDDKAVPTTSLTTTITNGGGTVFSAATSIISQVKTNTSTAISPTGASTTKIFVSVKGNKIAP